MEEFIRADMTADELEPIAMAVHLVAMEFPVTMRSKMHKGVRIEGVDMVFKDYTGPSLEKCLETGQIIREVPQSGPYKGVPVVVSPIFDKAGNVVAALGVFDLRHAMETPDNEE